MSDEGGSEKRGREGKEEIIFTRSMSGKGGGGGKGTQRTRQPVPIPVPPQSWPETERDTRIDRSGTVIFRTLTADFRRMRDSLVREKSAAIETTQHLIDRVTFDLKSTPYKEDVLLPKSLWKPSLFSLSSPEILERSCKHCG